MLVSQLGRLSGTGPKTLPAVTFHTWPSTFLACGRPLHADTGGQPPDLGAPWQPRHGHGPAVLEDRHEAGEMVPAGTQAPGFRQGRHALQPQPSDLPCLQPTTSQSPAGPPCQPSLSPQACRGPVHPALPRKPCSPSPPQEPPEHLCPRHQRVWGCVAQPLSVGFVAAATATPQPWLLNLLRAETVSPWLRCTLGDKLRTASKYRQAHRCIAGGPRGVLWSDRRF